MGATVDLRRRRDGGVLRMCGGHLEAYAAHPGKITFSSFRHKMLTRQQQRGHSRDFYFISEVSKTVYVSTGDHCPTPISKREAAR